MSRRTDIPEDRDGGDRLAGLSPAVSAGPPPGQTVLKFRRVKSAVSNPAAGDEPPSSPAIPIGDAVQAVVLRLANKRIRLRVARADEREDGGAGC